MLIRGNVVKVVEKEQSYGVEFRGRRGEGV